MYAWNSFGRPRGIRYLPAQNARPGAPFHVRPMVASWAWGQMDFPRQQPIVNPPDGLGGWGGRGRRARRGLGDDSGASLSLNDLVSAYGTFKSTQDVRVQLAKVQAEIANKQATLKSMPFLGPLYLNGDIAKLQAEEAALEQNLSLQQEGEAATEDWRAIGQTLGIAAIALVFVGTAVLALRGAR